MKKLIRRILIVICLGVLAASAGMIVKAHGQYRASRELYNGAVEQFTKPAAQPAQEVQGLETTTSGFAEAEKTNRIHAPIEVNFDSLTQINEDVIGWIYCENTVINYPVVFGRDNEYYLDRDYRCNQDPCGTIFTDASNTKGFADSNTILYGHHMQDMSMFATLEYWLDQEYYEAHPVMWLLTPEQDYRIELFSGYTTSATSDSYMIFYGPREEFNEYLRAAKEQSEFSADIELDGESHYVVLSTCAYSFDLARTVLHGKLVPVDSAGGTPIDNGKSAGLPEEDAVKHS